MVAHTTHTPLLSSSSTTHSVEPLPSNHRRPAWLDMQATSLLASMLAAKAGPLQLLCPAGNLSTTTKQQRTRNLQHLNAHTHTACVSASSQVDVDTPNKGQGIKQVDVLSLPVKCTQGWLLDWPTTPPKGLYHTQQCPSRARRAPGDELALPTHHTTAAAGVSRVEPLTPSCNSRQHAPAKSSGP